MVIAFFALSLQVAQLCKSLLAQLNGSSGEVAGVPLRSAIAALSTEGAKKLQRREPGAASVQ